MHGFSNVQWQAGTIKGTKSFQSFQSHMSYNVTVVRCPTACTSWYPLLSAKKCYRKIKKLFAVPVCVVTTHATAVRLHLLYINLPNSQFSRRLVASPPARIRSSVSVHAHAGDEYTAGDETSSIAVLDDVSP